MSEVESEHIVAACRFELGKVVVQDVRAAVVDQLRYVNHDLATRVAAGSASPLRASKA